MNATRNAIAALAIATSLVAGFGTAQASSHESGDANVVLNVAAAGSGVDEVVSQDANIDLDDGRGSVQAAANCQALFAVNVVAASASSASGLALLNDNDEVLIDGFLGILQEGSDRVIVDDHDRNATATCEQTLGTVRIVDDPVSGWGEVAPHGNAWDGLLGGPFGGSETNVIMQVVAAAASVDDVVSNDIDIDIDGGTAQSASNCQMMFAANVFAAATAVATGESTLNSDDRTNFTFDDRESPPVITPLQGRSVGVDSHERIATSSCSQSLDTFELFIGGEAKFPPES